MSATVRWDPSALNAAIARALRPAAEQWRSDAARASGSARIAAALDVRVGSNEASVTSSDPLTVWTEEGTKPHVVTPKGRVLRLADGRFVTGPVPHPGTRARPFLRPLLGSWPAIWRRYAAAACRAAGF